MAPLSPIFLGLLLLLAPAASQERLPPFTLSTDLGGEVVLQTGVPRNFSVAVTSHRDAPLAVRVAVAGDASALAGSPLELALSPRERREVSLALTPAVAGHYPGVLVVEGGGERREVAFALRVEEPLVGQAVDLTVAPGEARPGETVLVTLAPRVPGALRGTLAVRTEEGGTLFEQPFDLPSGTARAFEVTLPPGTSAGPLRVEADIPGLGSTFRELAVLPAPFPTHLLLLPATAVAAAVLLRWREEFLALLAMGRRYPPLSSYGTLPRGPLAVGHVAGTRRRLGLEPGHLRGHLLVAGATGGGKSVAAMVLAEELLRRNWAVVVCDPTAQWSGLLRPCRDRALLRRYRAFGLREPAGWPAVRRETPDLDPAEVAPGRLLLFDFPENYEANLGRLLDRLLEAGPARAETLLVLEEVHRALPKYGAPPHLYPLVESVVRAARSRNVALVLTSQLASDFSEEIRNNVLGELQTLTKGAEDLERLERKYGREVGRLATRLEPGVALLHHPQVNDGRPVAVAFRPTLGDPHKLPGPVLERWRDLWNRYRRLAEKAQSPKARQSLAMARERLERFQLEMAQVYLDEVE